MASGARHHDLATPTTKRGRECRACGVDEWEVDAKGYDRCKACHRRQQREAKARQRSEDPALALFWLARTRAKQKGMPFTITADDVRSVWPADGKCPVLGIELKRGSDKRALDSSPTLDRLNNAWGYERGNIVVLSMKANRTKGSCTARELETIAAWMRRNGLE